MSAIGDISPANPIPAAELAVIVPAFNEVATIAALTMALRREAEQVIVVDDGSTDGTAEAIEHLPVTLRRHDRNLGKGAALRSGLEAAAETLPRWIATIDGDGQHGPEIIAGLLRRGQQRRSDLVIGQRAGKRWHAPCQRRLANGVADLLISWAARRRLPDTQSGLRLYRGEMLRELLTTRHLWASHFAWEAELLIELCRRGARVDSVAIASVYNGLHRTSHYRPWTDSLRISAMLAGKILRPDPMLHRSRQGRDDVEQHAPRIEDSP